MQCRDVRDLADSFLSEQLLVETNHELVRHLETCPDCRAAIADGRALREKLRGAFERADSLRPRPDLAAELMAKARPAQSVMSRRSFLRTWLAAAAGVVLAGGGSLVVRDARSRSRLALLAREAAGDHQNCAVKFRLAERPIRLEEAGRRYGPPYGALATFDASGIDGLLTLERHACVYEGRRFGHVVFRYHGALVSLLVTDGTPPSAPELQPDGNGAAVAALPAGRYVGFIVGALDRAQVLHLANALTRPLSRHLA
jgi:hypothetical protein